MIKIFIVALAAFSFPHIVLADADLIKTLESGSWGWPEGDTTCALNPQRMSFTDDMRDMEYSWAVDHDPITYRILDFNGSDIMMFIDGETRETSRGDKVVWS